MENYSGLRITKFLLVETGTYNDMVVRPYQSTLDLRSVMQFQEVTEGGHAIDSTRLSGLAGQIIRPSSKISGMANIQNGWEMRRLRFLMEVEEVGHFGGTVLYHYITGYTDHVGATPSGAVDPNMLFYFNNSVTVRSNSEHTPVGRREHRVVADASQIIPTMHNIVPGNYSALNGNIHLLRPMDVVSGMRVNMLGDPDLHDLTTTPVASAQKSRRDNGSAPSYLSRTLKGMKSGTADDDGIVGMEEIYEKVRSMVAEPAISQDSFFAHLATSTSYNMTGSVSYSDLCRIFPEADHLADIRLRGEVMQQTQVVAERGSTEHWQGTTTETITATVLAHAVPALMMDLMITKFTFAATNRTMDGRFAIDVRNAASFAQGMDMNPYLDRLCDRLEYEVFRDLTRNNMLGISLQMAVNILGDTMITISVDGGPEIDYVIPSFCDGLISPIVGGSRDDLYMLAADLDQLHSNLQPLQPTAPQHQPGMSLGGEFNRAGDPFEQQTPMGGFGGKIDSVI